MALYQPTNIFPSSFAGRGGGTVDAGRPLTVSWQMNGNSAMTGYQIEIFQNTAASVRVYSSGRVNVPPFWGVSSTGQTQYYHVDIPNPGLVNGYDPGYKLQITQYWDGGSIRQSSPSYFITRAAPTLSIQSFANPVAGRSATFTASYAQAQGDGLDWFRWMLCQAGQEDAPLEDSGNIYGSGDIRVSYDGLFTGTDYRVRCMLQTENGVQADTGWVDFYRAVCRVRHAGLCGGLPPSDRGDRPAVAAGVLHSGTRDGERVRRNAEPPARGLGRLG